MKKMISVSLDYFGAASFEAMRNLESPARAERRKAVRDLTRFLDLSGLRPKDAAVSVVGIGVNALGHKVLIFVFQVDVEAIAGTQMKDVILDPEAFT